MEPFYKKNSEKVVLKNTQIIAKNIITLPLYSQMTIKEQDKVINALNTIL